MSLDQSFADLLQRAADDVITPTGLVDRGIARGRLLRRRRRTASAALAAGIAAAVVGGGVVATGGDGVPVAHDPPPAPHARVPVDSATASRQLADLLPAGPQRDARHGDGADGRAFASVVYDGGLVEVQVLPTGNEIPVCDPADHNECVFADDGSWTDHLGAGDDEDWFLRAIAGTADGLVVQVTAHAPDDVPISERIPGPGWEPPLDTPQLLSLATSDGWFRSS